MGKLWLDGIAKLNVVRMKGPNLFPELVGNAVMVSDKVVHEHRLTSSPVVCLSKDFYRHEKVELTKDAPVSEKYLESLNDRCLVKVGTEVQSGSILASATSPTLDEQVSIEEQLLRALFGKSAAWRDCSFCYELDDPGVVTRVDLVQENLPVDVAFRVEVEVVVRRELRVGDILHTSDGTKLRVAKIVPQREMNYLFRRSLVDVLVGPDLAIDLPGSGYLRHRSKRGWTNWFKTVGAVTHVTKISKQLEDKQEFRSMGNYSLISQQPVGSLPNPSQMVSWDMAQALLKAGYSENLREMFSIKSDAIEGRAMAYEATIKGQEILLDQPYSTTRLKHIFCGLGFELKINNDQFWLLPMSDDGRKKLSFGVVKISETINYRTYRFEPDGIFCERIFGTSRDFECRCGKYKGTKYKGIICEKCGVKVTASRVRGQRFGHINLVKPVIHPWFFSRVASLLEVELSELRQLVYEQGGVDKVKAELESRGIPLQGLIMETIPVIPPDLRPLFQLNDGRWCTADVNDLYRRVVIRSKRTARLIELNAPQVIIESEARTLQQAVDALMDNLACPRPVLGEADRPLNSLKGMLTETVESIRNKRSNFSARAITVPDVNIAKGTVGVPLTMAIQLFLPALIRELKATGKADTIKMAKRLLEQTSVEVRDLVLQVVGQERVLAITEANKVSALVVALCDGEVLRLNPEDVKALELTSGEGRLKVFAPLRKEAKVELLEPKPMSDVSSNLDFDRLLETILSGNSTNLTPVDSILLGIS